VPAPTGLPDLFLDRSLGRITVPRLLREAGLSLVTLTERYGIPTGERVTDEEWLSDAGRCDEVVLTKDTRLRYNVAEMAAIRRHRVRCYCLSRQDLTGVTMAEYFLGNLRRIAATCQEPGPFLYVVHRNQIRNIAL